MEEAIEYLYKKDDIFKQISQQFGIPIQPKRPQGFETLVLLILEQQVSIDSAKATFIKLNTAIPDFSVENVFAFSEENFRTCGVSRQKTKYIKALAEAILSKELDLESLAFKDVEVVRQELIKIKGIGNWTIDIYLMFCLESLDIIPLGDIAVVNTMKELLDIHTKEEMEIYTQKWKPYRSVATYFLWHYYLEKRGRKITY
ncbi:DNA-3-methyladenine glycosylase 2 family protein [Flavobacterium sp. HXWNR29]|uniref:DNA-3-methyladenine glycosylase family protein n=1 Tax=Flavobacterium odoriferum TaxID=2946604 RepID=UPI0021CB7FCA|nr:DNA-3-methyladenine glycosylase 2 family protein [Flavobacterium sp. HXWNR29]MCU4189043.1 DNA-3-methyladenine glycosylase 2 family protein [Flavobacterium sp. HXWNR29]